jgi:hypothetical protein
MSIGHSLGRGVARKALNPQPLRKEDHGSAGKGSDAFGAVGSFLIVIVLGIYFAAEPNTYINGTARLFPEENRERVCEAFSHNGPCPPLVADRPDRRHGGKVL